ncbi:MAG: phosphatase PAP2 family protein [Deltaproteobacteria bacterium]|nr:phosphatase PAP2 family protein [Deltaproteobacteria bacterium]
METFVRLDTALFRFINESITAYWLDPVMQFVTLKFNFLGAIIIAATFIIVLGRRPDRIGLAVLVAAVGAADLICNVLKHLIMRARPCAALSDVRMLVGCTNSFSLPSGHATNIFAAMVFLSLRYKKFTPLFLSFAFLVAFSRVYVGVHYPFDVAAGGALGAGAAFAFTWAEKKGMAYYEQRTRPDVVEE